MTETLFYEESSKKKHTHDVCTKVCGLCISKLQNSN